MKKFKSFVFVLMAVMTLMSTKPSQAAIGAIVAAPIVVTGGLVVAGVGAGITLVSLYGPETGGGWGNLFGFVYGGIISAFGIVILDGEEGQGMSYSPISVKDAQKLGITALEMKSFNAELDQVNALAAHVDAEVAQIENATEDDAAAIWNDVKHAVSAETFAAMVKVTSQVVK